ncbi:MAG: SDR family oxidoreductase [Ruminococcus flavefaciens]|nr:SDR family oxidoreductase [Ruminococcus flavefaciens]
MRVVVTGGAHGIGRAIVAKFVQEGHDVFDLDIRYNGGVEIEGRKWRQLRADVALPESLPDIPDVDILINNAGTFDQDVDNIAVNLLGTRNCTEKYGIHPGIKAIVNIASTSAHNGAEFPMYAASKGGVLAYSKWTALRIAEYGATCNSISPGGVITPSNNHILKSPELTKQVMSETTLYKWASEEEIAEWVYFVAVINKSMTGQDIIIDNGETTKANFIW